MSVHVVSVCVCVYERMNMHEWHVNVYECVCSCVLLC